MLGNKWTNPAGTLFHNCLLQEPLADKSNSRVSQEQLCHLAVFSKAELCYSYSAHSTCPCFSALVGRTFTEKIQNLVDCTAST